MFASETHLKDGLEGRPVWILRANVRLHSECPAGFLGFAVNMINIDSSNLFCVTPSGYGLRETLFYNLFSRMQVYKTRAEMMQALPFISDGALSLDGGMVRSCGVFYLGNRYGNE